MRIATTQIFQQSMNSLLDQQAKLARTQQQISSGERLLSPADDPVAAARILDLESVTAQIDQYQSNADAAEARLTREETALSSAVDLLQRVRDLAVRANNDTLSAEDRGAIAVEVRATLDGLLQLANTRDANGEYLFAGYRTDTEPFSHDGAGTFSYAGDDGQRSHQIGATRQLVSGDPGSAVFMGLTTASGTDSVFGVLYDFAADLDADAPDPATLTDLDAALDQVLTVQASIGGRMNALDDQRGINESFKLTTETTRSQLADLDYAEAITRFNLQLTALEAAQQTFVKVQGLSLFNYL